MPDEKLMDSAMDREMDGDMNREMDSRMAAVPKWARGANRKLARHFEFADFIAAFGFLTQVAIVAESLNHHPEIANIYNKVDLQLFTHDFNGLTAMDFTLAGRIDQIASQMGLQ